MRTNIDIDEELMAEAMEATGLKTKKATIEKALKAVVEARRRRQAMNELWGMGWTGDLDKMREGRTFEDEAVDEPAA